jgi:hypothetical protein
MAQIKITVDELQENRAVVEERINNGERIVATFDGQNADRGHGSACR